MKPWIEYENTRPFPDAASYLTEKWYAGDKLVAIREKRKRVTFVTDLKLTPEELKLCRKTTETNKVGYRLEMAEYKEETDRLHEQFKQDLFNDLGIAENPKREELFEKAWELGHHKFDAAFHWAEDLVKLIR